MLPASLGKETCPSTKNHVGRPCTWPNSSVVLIAEMSAAFLCGQAEIAERTLENSAANVQNWIEALQNDKKLIVQAA